MDNKRVLLIGIQKSFMINAIMIGLLKEDFQVETVDPSEVAVKQMPDKPRIYILYLGDLTEDHYGLLKYLSEAIDAERGSLYMRANSPKQ